MRATRFALFTLLGLLIAPVSAFADGFILIHAPQPLIRPPRPSHYVFAPLAVAYHQVEVKIEDQIALTSVDEEFVNPSDATLEGTYVFPLPPGAEVEKFSMFIDGKETDAELLDAVKARALYEDIVRKMKDPALLEYAGRGLLKARIFPIEPHSRKRVKISYRQLLQDDGGLMEYVYPLNTEKFSSAPVERVSVKVDIACRAAAIKAVYSPSHKVEVTRKDEKHVVVGFEEKGTRPDTDFHLCISRDPRALGMNLMTWRPDPKQDGCFLLLASPGLVPEGKAVEKDVVFVLDTSGSMSGAKMEQARKALRFCVNSLEDGDRFEIIRFSTEAEPFFHGLKPATPENRKAAQAFLDGLKAMGGTAIDEALQKALALQGEIKKKNPGDPDRPFVVIFLTDGQPTIGERDDDAIVARALKVNTTTRVFCFGIGTDINTHLLDRITEATRSASQYVFPEEDLEIKLSSFWGRIQAPVLTDVKVSFGEGIKVSKVHPGTQPDLFRGDQMLVFGRYTGSGPVAVTVEGRFQGELKRFVMEGTFPDESRDRSWVGRLWASRRVGFLLDEIRLRGESAELKDEVSALAREFGIVTPYTAYLILEDERKQVAQGLMRPDASALRELAQDGEANDRSRSAYGDWKGEKSGRTAVESRNAMEGQKNQDSGGGAAPPSAGLAKRDGGNYAQQCRRVGDKTFYQNGNAWVDADVQRSVQAKRVQVKFGSEEYFDLCHKAPEAAPWLSVGQNLQIALGDVVYEITE